MKSIPVNLLYSRFSKQRNKTKINDLIGQFWRLREFNTKGITIQLERIEVEDLKDRDSLPYSQIWVIFVCPKLINPFLDDDPNFGLSITKKICQQYEKGKAKLILPVEIERIDAWDFLPFSKFYKIVPKTTDLSIAVTEICNAVLEQVNLLIYQNESKELLRSVDYQEDLQIIYELFFKKLSIVQEDLDLKDNWEIDKFNEQLRKYIKEEKEKRVLIRQYKPIDLRALLHWNYGWDPLPFLPSVVSLLIIGLSLILWGVINNSRLKEPRIETEPQKPVIQPFK